MKTYLNKSGKYVSEKPEQYVVGRDKNGYLIYNGNILLLKRDGNIELVIVSEYSNQYWLKEGIVIYTNSNEYYMSESNRIIYELINGRLLTFEDIESYLIDYRDCIFDTSTHPYFDLKIK